MRPKARVHSETHFIWPTDGSTDRLHLAKTSLVKTRSSSHCFWKHYSLLQMCHELTEPILVACGKN